MPKIQGVKVILGQARKLERRYDWLEAIESYRKALGLALRARKRLGKSQLVTGRQKMLKDYY
jgi:hypothetical protein